MKYFKLESPSFACKNDIIIATIIIFSTILYSANTLNPQSTQKKPNLGKANLVLYQGKTRHEIVGKNCPVGISFLKPEKFSCACVNGIWAFYDTLCAPPLTIKAGNNYCFQMPNDYIQQIMIISNPMRALDGSLTVFEGEMESIRTKVYRNIHIPLNGKDYFLTLNSSWTIQNPEATDRICLNSKQNVSSLETSSNTTMSDSNYCNFVNISRLMPKIGSILKGCNDTTFNLNPTDCNPVLSSNNEDLCTSDTVLNSYAASLVAEENSVDGVLPPVKRRWKSTTIPTTIPPTTTTTATTTTSTTAKSARPKPEPIVVSTTTTETPGEQESESYEIQDLSLNSDLGIIGDTSRTNDIESSGNDIHTVVGRNAEYGDTLLSEAEMISKANAEWSNINNFLIPPEINSEKQILNQIWKYETTNFQKNLGLLPSTVESVASINNDRQNVDVTSQVRGLLERAKNILLKICPVVSEEYLNLAVDAFFTVQRKNFRWQEPYIEKSEFDRILSSILACESRATKFHFSPSTTCAKHSPLQIENRVDKANKSVWLSTQDNFVPTQFISKGYEPIIETVWKIFVSAHSYCFSDFADFYNDHHKFATLISPAFTNEIHNLWIDHNGQDDEEEYGGVIGSAEGILRDLDICAAGTRLNSEYPFHLTRPSAAFVNDPEGKRNYGRNANKHPNISDGDADNSLTVKLEDTHQPDTNSKETEKVITDTPDVIKRPEVEGESTKTNSFKPENSKESQLVENTTGVKKLRKRRALLVDTNDWKKNRKILKGIGYCLKKYDEPRVQLNQNCDL